MNDAGMVAAHKTPYLWKRPSAFAQVPVAVLPSLYDIAYSRLSKHVLPRYAVAQGYQANVGQVSFAGCHPAALINAF